MARAMQSFQGGDLDEAEKNLFQVLIIQSKNFDALHISGVVKGLRNQHQEALEFFRKALRIDPNNSFLNFNIAKAFSEVGDEEKALKYYLYATKLNPAYPQGWLNLGKSLLNLKNLKESLECFSKAVALNPEYAEAWSNRGNVLFELKQYDQALASFNVALKINPQLAEAWSNRGTVLFAICQFELGEASCREAIRINPNYLSAHNNLLFNLNYIHSFNNQEALKDAVSYGLKVSQRSTPKFTNWNTRSSIEKLRIGFVSGDLINHPVGFFIEGLIGHLDLTKFEIYAFPTASTTDDLTDRIKPFFIEWIPIYGKSDIDAASIIHQKGINILVDLSGHTDHNRLPIFSYKPAPVQVSWLGYFATTGLPEMDYFLGDPYLLPANEASHFTETVWKLAETWLCLKPPQFQLPVSELPALKNGFITFGSFGNFSKINDKVLITWASVLHRVPTAKLFIKSKQLGDAAQIEVVNKRFEKCGISTERLILEGPDSREAYFKAYNRVDLVLDTFPYPGGTTSLDALWMGVPVLTVKGYRFLSHLGESIAINGGNPDWISEDADDYVKKAVKFSSDFKRLDGARRTLRDRVLKSPLFDTERFAKNFSDALWGMWFQSAKSRLVHSKTFN